MVEHGIFVSNRSNVVIAGEHVENASGRGIYVLDCTDVTIRDCIVVGNAQVGISVHRSKDVLIQGNAVYNNGTLDLEGNGIAVGSSSNVTIQGNNVYDNAGDGIDIDGAGIGWGFTISHNRTYRNGWRAGYGIKVGALAGNSCCNVIHHNTAWGNYVVGGGGVQFIVGNRQTWANNTGYSAGSGNWSICMNLGPVPTSDVVVFNNILCAVSGTNQLALRTYPGCTISQCDRNLMYIAKGSKPIVYDGTARTWAQWKALGFDEYSPEPSDPLFVNPTQGDFRLLSNSPAWPDIGACEFVQHMPQRRNENRLNSSIPSQGGLLISMDRR